MTYLTRLERIMNKLLYTLVSHLRNRMVEEAMYCEEVEKMENILKAIDKLTLLQWKYESNTSHKN